MATGKKTTSKKTVPGKIPRKKKATRKKRSTGKAPLKDQLFRSMAGICLLVALVVTAAILFRYLLPDPQNEHSLHSETIRPAEPTGLKEKESAVKKDAPSPLAGIPGADSGRETRPASPKKPVAETAADKAPAYEVFPDKDFASPREQKKPPAETPTPKLPKIAIIIDDLGYDTRLAKKFLEMDTRFTFAVIPHSPHHRQIAEQVRARGGELMLHLPMEPKEYPDVDPGPGALLTRMSPDELIDQLKTNIEAVPGIKGVNGHMGSRLTEDSAKMNQVFTILKRENLYFVDSFTTPDSVCLPSAKLLKVPFARRDVFIDHRQDPQFVRGQLDLLLRIAEKHGEAVGIVHPYKVTIDVLRQYLPKLKKKADLTPASHLVRIVG